MSGADFYSLDPSTQAYILDQPALQPPDEEQPDFDHPPNGSAGAIVLFSICLVLITFALLGRVYMRFLVMKQRSVEDCESNRAHFRG
jgi:hypothetical protein